MKTWRSVCIDGFVTEDKQAATREEAHKILKKNPELNKHVKDHHPEFKTKTPKQIDDWYLALVQLVV
jgi:hypothetical protein